MANRITTLFDFDTSGATRSLSQLRTELKNADGFRAKFQVGAAGLKGVLKGNVGEAALAAGAALVAFGAKSVSAFQDTALEAGKFADATGLSVEQASRWIEVAGDVGISGEQMQTVFLRLNKAIGDGIPELSQYGIEAKKTADGQVDVNATMLDAIRKIGAIADPTEKAAAAQKLFGRSYAEAAELIFANADSVAKKLGEVSDAKVIDEDELKKAREFRALMDNLQDAVQDLSLAAGEYLVPILQEAGETIEKLNDIVKKGTGDQGGLMGALKTGAKIMTGDAMGAVEGLTAAHEEQAEATRKAEAAVIDMADAERSRSTVINEASTAQNEHNDLLDLQAQYAEVAEAKIQALNDQQEREKDAAEKAARAHDLKVQAMESELQAAEELYSQTLLNVGGEIAVREAKIQTEDAITNLAEVMKDEKSTLRDVELAQIDVQKSALAQAEAAVQLAEDQAAATGKTLDAKDKAEIYRTELQKVADQLEGPMRDAILGFIADLDSIPASKTVQINLQGGGTVTVGPDGRKRGARGATGGIVTQPTQALIGEAGPEAVIPLNQMPGASPLPSGGLGGITANFYGITDEAAVRRALSRALQMARFT